MPIYKKGNKTDVHNYSPISLITTFTKILESYVLQTKLTPEHKEGFDT